MNPFAILYADRFTTPLASRALILDAGCTDVGSACTVHRAPSTRTKHRAPSTRTKHRHQAPAPSTGTTHQHQALSTQHYAPMIDPFSAIACTRAWSTVTPSPGPCGGASVPSRGTRGEVMTECARNCGPLSAHGRTCPKLL